MKPTQIFGTAATWGERVKRGRRKKGAVRFRMVEVGSYAYTDQRGERRERDTTFRDEVVEIRPGDTIEFWFQTEKSHDRLSGGEHNTLNGTRFTATLLPPEEPS